MASEFLRCPYCGAGTVLKWANVVGEEAPLNCSSCGQWSNRSHWGREESERSSERDDLIRLHEELSNAARETMRAKNSDYTARSAEDPLANFRLLAQTGAGSVEQGILARMLDKAARIGTFVKRGTYEVEDESFRDTIVDLINYAVLMEYARQERKEHSDDDD